MQAEITRFNENIEKLSKLDLSEEETERQILKAIEKAREIGRKMNSENISGV